MSSRHLLTLAFALNLFWTIPAFAASFVSDVESGLIKSNSIQTAHFQFEFSDVLAGQADEDNNDIADIIEVVAEAAENSWDVVIDDMGYEEPTEDGSPVIVILDDNYEYLSSGALGITSILSNGNPYIAIDPWMSNSYLQVTMGHEFFHSVQFGYDINFAYTYQGLNFAEATATWMEDNLFDDVNDYALYIPEFLSYVDYSIFASVVPSGSLYEYGMNIWPKFLGEYYDTGIIKEIWETYFDSNVSYDSDLKLYDAVKAVVEEHGDELPELFQEFTLWNLDLTQYEEGDIYPEVMILEGEESQDYVLSDSYYAPALYGTNYLYFENKSGDSEFYFHLVKPKGVSFAVSLVPYDGVNYDIDEAVTTIIDEDESMDEPLSLTKIGSKDGVVAIVSTLEVDFDEGNNWEVFDQGYLYYYLADYGLSENEFNALVDGGNLSESIEEEGKEGEDIEEAPDVRNENTLVLSLLDFDEKSATFSWNRLSDNDVEGYEIRYGTSSGSTSKTQEIANAYTTFSMVSGLKEGQTYYFSLVAVDGSGSRVGERSSEIVVTPEQWIFEDVSYLDPHYDAISGLVDEGIFEGYDDNTFRSDNVINRAELLKILVEGRGIEVDASEYKNCFPDVREEWFAKYVCYAKSEGWVKGYSNGKFQPADPVNKVEALKMLFEVHELGLVQDSAVAELKYSDLDENAWYAIYVWKASALGILEEPIGQNFSPDNDRSRGEMAEELYRYLVVSDQLKE